MGGIGAGKVGAVIGRNWLQNGPVNQKLRISNQGRFNLMKSQVKTNNETNSVWLFWALPLVYTQSLWFCVCMWVCVFVWVCSRFLKLGANKAIWSWLCLHLWAYLLIFPTLSLQPIHSVFQLHGRSKFPQVGYASRLLHAFLCSRSLLSGNAFPPSPPSLALLWILLNPWVIFTLCGH